MENTGKKSVLKTHTAQSGWLSPNIESTAKSCRLPPALSDPITLPLTISLLLTPAVMLLPIRVTMNRAPTQANALEQNHSCS